MGKKIKEFINSTYLEFNKGKFDDYCVYFVTSNNRHMPLKDVDYFTKLKKYASIYTPQKVYNDFVKIYDLTTFQIEQSTLDYITQIASFYKESYSLDVLFTVLYMTMVAEEQKENTKLGKKIKRLGVYKLLIENKSIDYSANFMRGMSWQQIELMCKQCGF